MGMFVLTMMKFDLTDDAVANKSTDEAAKQASIKETPVLKEVQRFTHPFLVQDDDADNGPYFHDSSEGI